MVQEVSIIIIVHMPAHFKPIKPSPTPRVRSYGKVNEASKLNNKERNESNKGRIKSTRAGINNTVTSQVKSGYENQVAVILKYLVLAIASTT